MLAFVSINTTFLKQYDIRVILFEILIMMASPPPPHNFFNADPYAYCTMPHPMHIIFLGK